ncbi:uncharacterized protein [Pseudorasbora parva]|uniref:uncharacterized protein n=1 Tax=Pseudorasbora parva TaxID=51549 RepID=UPI00351E7A85
MSSNTNCKEVSLEVYVNGELYCIDSVWVPDEENVQVDFMVTDGIYELLGCSPGDLTAQLQVDSDECLSVSRAALEGEDLHIDIDMMKRPACICTTPEDSPTESTTEWMARKMSGFIQTLFWRAPAPEPEPEVNLVTVRWPEEGPENEENCPKRVMKKISSFFLKCFPVSSAEPLCDPETEPDMDLVEPKESCVPDANVPETEPVSVEGQDVNFSGDMDSEKMKKMSAFFQKYFPVDPSEPTFVPETEPVSAEDQKVDGSDGMKASPQMNGPGESTTEWMARKMSGFFPMLFWIDTAVPEPTPEPEVNLVSVGWAGNKKNSPKRESTKVKKMSAFLKKYFPLDPSEPLCVPDASVPETEPVSSGGPEVNVSDGMDASPEKEMKLSAFLKKYFPLDPSEPPCVPDASVPESKPVSAEVREVNVSDGVDASPEKVKKMSAFFKKYFPLDPAEPPCVPDASVPETKPVSSGGPQVNVSDDMDASPEKEMKLSAFLKKYFPLDPAEPLCVPETKPELDLFDSDDLRLPGPSSSVPKPSKQEQSPEEHCLLLEKRMKGCTQRHRPVTAVWNNIFIGNEEIAKDRMRLKELGITHVLNVAAVKTKLRVLLGVPWEKDLREAVNTGASYYKGMNISYCGLPASQGSDISEYLYKAAKFIQKAKKSTENKVFIHCTDGVSYAPTFFLAYLMIHHNMTVEDAIDNLIKVRYIKPDTEFLKQLAVLNRDLEQGKQQLKDTQAGSQNEVLKKKKSNTK